MRRVSGLPFCRAAARAWRRCVLPPAGHVIEAMIACRMSRALAAMCAAPATTHLGARSRSPHPPLPAPAHAVYLHRLVRGLALALALPHIPLMTSRADLPAAPRPASPDLSLGKQSLPASREPHLAKLSSPLPHAPPAETHSDFVPHVSDLEKQPTRDAGPPYTIFVASQRATVVVLLTSVGFLSPITGSIYMSGLTDVSRDLLVSQEMVQLSVTVFMIFQGISPLIIGSNTDKVGRRPVLIFSLVLYMAADIGIYFLPHATHSNKGAVYAGLLILRAVQACGSASTVSIGAVRFCPLRRAPCLFSLRRVRMLADATTGWHPGHH